MSDFATNLIKTSNSRFNTYEARKVNQMSNDSQTVANAVNAGLNTVSNVTGVISKAIEQKATTEYENDKLTIYDQQLTDLYSNIYSDNSIKWADKATEFQKQASELVKVDDSKSGTYKRIFKYSYNSMISPYVSTLRNNAPAGTYAEISNDVSEINKKVVTELEKGNFDVLDSVNIDSINVFNRKLDDTNLIQAKDGKELNEYEKAYNLFWKTQYYITGSKEDADAYCENNKDLITTALTVGANTTNWENLHSESNKDTWGNDYSVGKTYVSRHTINPYTGEEYGELADTINAKLEATYTALEADDQKRWTQQFQTNVKPILNQFKNDGDNTNDYLTSDKFESATMGIPEYAKTKIRESYKNILDNNDAIVELKNWINTGCSGTTPLKASEYMIQNSTTGGWYFKDGTGFIDISKDYDSVYDKDLDINTDYTTDANKFIPVATDVLSTYYLLGNIVFARDANVSHSPAAVDNAVFACKLIDENFEVPDDVDPYVYCYDSLAEPVTEMYAKEYAQIRKDSGKDYDEAYNTAKEQISANVDYYIQDYLNGIYNNEFKTHVREQIGKKAEEIKASSNVSDKDVRDTVDSTSKKEYSLGISAIDFDKAVASKAEQVAEFSDNGYSNSCSTIKIDGMDNFLKKASDNKWTLREIQDNAKSDSNLTNEQKDQICKWKNPTEFINKLFNTDVSDTMITELDKYCATDVIKATEYNSLINFMMPRVEQGEDPVKLIDEFCTSRKTLAERSVGNVFAKMLDVEKLTDIGKGTDFNDSFLKALAKKFSMNSNGVLDSSLMGEVSGANELINDIFSSKEVTDHFIHILGDSTLDENEVLKHILAKVCDEAGCGSKYKYGGDIDVLEQALINNNLGNDSKKTVNESYNATAMTIVTASAYLLEISNMIKTVQKEGNNLGTVTKFNIGTRTFETDAGLTLTWDYKKDGSSKKNIWVQPKGKNAKDAVAISYEDFASNSALKTKGAEISTEIIKEDKDLADSIGANLLLNQIPLYPDKDDKIFNRIVNQGKISFETSGREKVKSYLQELTDAYGYKCQLMYDNQSADDVKNGNIGFWCGASVNGRSYNVSISPAQKDKKGNSIPPTFNSTNKQAAKYDTWKGVFNALPIKGHKFTD